MSTDMDERINRLKVAAEQKDVPWSPTALGAFLQVNKQTADRWMRGGMPRPDQLFAIADKFGVNPRWLANDSNDMLLEAPADLEPEERELVHKFKEDRGFRAAIRYLLNREVPEREPRMRVREGNGVKIRRSATGVKGKKGTGSRT